MSDIYKIYQRENKVRDKRKSERKSHDSIETNVVVQCEIMSIFFIFRSV